MNFKANNGAASICASYVSKDDIVLECACGTGIMTKIIAPHCRKVIATDCSRKIMISTYISKEANTSARITKIFNKMGANFQNEFDINTYRQSFTDKAIEAAYRVAYGSTSCCVAIISV